MKNQTFDKRFTQEQFEKALAIPLMPFLEQRGYEFKRCGNEFHMKDHDSFVVSNNLWCWNSQNMGGNILGFLTKVEQMNIHNGLVLRLFADGVDISSAVGNLSWQNSISELATTVSFDVAKSDARHTSIYLPKEGSIIQMYTNEEIFRGIVLTVDDGSKTTNTYTAADFGWYLNKSKETYQFNNMPAHKAIRKVCGDFNIAIDSIPTLVNEITKIYFDKTISEILADILEQCGGGYNLDVTPRGLRIYEMGSIYAYPEFRLSPNTQLLYSPNLRGNVSHSISIEDMKNSIKVITETDGSYSVKKVVQDTDLIGKFGLLQEVVKIDPEKENADTVAQEQLSELSKVKESFSFEIIEAVDSYSRAGYMITVDGVAYIIEGSDHSIKNGVHYVKLDLRKFG